MKLKKSTIIKRRHNLQRVVEEAGMTLNGQGKGKPRVVKNITPAKLKRLFEVVTARCGDCNRRLYHPVSVVEGMGPVCGGHNYHR